MSHERIDACYDSHVHWAATGEFAGRLHLQSLARARDILQIDPTQAHLQQGWLLGFGWDETAWPDRELLHRRLLDEWCPHLPVLLTRVDGHVGWLNTAALKAVGWSTDEDETGVLGDLSYGKILAKVPRPGPGDIRRHLLKATQMFHAEGFTHIRDVGGAFEHWQQAVLLDRARLLNLAVEMFFHLPDVSRLEEFCAFIEVARSVSPENLRAKGIKIFADGALGSEGAWISAPYASGSGHGQRVLTDADIERVCGVCWSRGLEVAVHVIGDAAVHNVVTIADRLRREGIVGTLHLEHVEIVRPETIELMKGLRVTCHLQPCHWLSDRRWLKEKVGDTLCKWSFPWRRLQEAGIVFDFGSDTPVEPPSIARTLQALNESEAAGWPKLLGNPDRFLSHSDRSWAPNSFTVFENGRPVQVVFRGDHLS